MDLYSFAPIAAVLDAAYSVVSSLVLLLDPLAGTSAAALAVVLITVFIRAVLIPVGRSQVRAERARARLAPQLRELQRRYAKSPEVLQKKTMELYAAEGVSPLAGCLPTLLQAPVLSTVYALFALGRIAGHPNLLLTHELAGVPLGSSLLHLLAAPTVPGVALFAGLLLLIAVVAWLSRRAAMQNTADVASAATPRLAATLTWLPFLTVVFAATVPLAATLYLATSTTWTLIERAILRRQKRMPRTA